MNKDCKLINKEELLSFVKLVYQEGCFGHLDLIDNFCDNLVEDFYKKLPSGDIVDSVGKITLTTAPILPNFHYFSSEEI
jgi:hypothetical protein